MHYTLLSTGPIDEWYLLGIVCMACASILFLVYYTLVALHKPTIKEITAAQFDEQYQEVLSFLQRAGDECHVRHAEIIALRTFTRDQILDPANEQKIAYLNAEFAKRPTRRTKPINLFEEALSNDSLIDFYQNISYGTAN